MPLWVDIYLAVGRDILTPIVELYFRFARKVTDHAPIIAEIILAIDTGTLLVLQLINVVGKDQLKNDILVKNGQSIAPIMTFVKYSHSNNSNLCNYFFEKPSATANPSKHQRLTKIAIPGLVSLMVTLLHGTQQFIYFIGT